MRRSARPTRRVRRSCSRASSAASAGGASPSSATAPRYEAILDRTGWKLRPGSGARPGSLPPDVKLRRRRDPKTLSLADAQDALRAIEPLFRSLGDDQAATTELESQAARFAAAHVGYLAWDVVHLIEKVPPGDQATWDRHFLPLARFLGGATIVVFDALAQTVTIAAASEEADRARTARSRACAASLEPRAAGSLAHPERRHRRPRRRRSTRRAFARRRSTSPPATRSRSSSRARSRCRAPAATPSTSTARCGCSIRRRTCTSSISRPRPARRTARASRARARRRWCASRAAR